MRTVWYWEARFFVKAPKTEAKQVTLKFEADEQVTETEQLRRVIDTVSARFQDPNFVYGISLRKRYLILE